MSKIKSRRARATSAKGSAELSTKTALPGRGERTNKVAIPATLHKATKSVAARFGVSVQNFVAECLRNNAAIDAEETHLIKRQEVAA